MGTRPIIRAHAHSNIHKHAYNHTCTCTHACACICRARETNPVKGRGETRARFLRSIEYKQIMAKCDQEYAEAMARAGNAHVNMNALCFIVLIY